MRLKKSYLSLDSSKQKYIVEHFSRLRAPLDYEGLHYHPNPSKSSEMALQHMLWHSGSHSIPTSLTVLSPSYSALAVWIFSHLIRGIERNIYSSPEVQLKSLITVGRMVVPLRDEIFLQIIKQLRNNKDTVSYSRLWRLLGACLYHFPPSQSFENYLELYILAESEISFSVATSMGFVGMTTPGTGGVINRNAATIVANHRSMIAKQCLRLLHESVIKYGYYHSMLGFEDWDSSLRCMRSWLADSSHPYFPVFRHLFVQSSDLSSPSEDATDVTYVDPASEVNVEAAVTVHQIRATRDNWLKRFSYFLGSYINSKKNKSPSNITSKEFLGAFTDKDSPVDPLDRYLLCFLIFGYPVDGSFNHQIYRELHVDREMLHYRSDIERLGSEVRDLVWRIICIDFETL